MSLDCVLKNYLYQEPLSNIIIYVILIINISYTHIYKDSIDMWAVVRFKRAVVEKLFLSRTSVGLHFI